MENHFPFRRKLWRYIHRIDYAQHSTVNLLAPVFTQCVSVSDVRFDDVKCIASSCALRIRTRTIEWSAVGAELCNTQKNQCDPSMCAYTLCNRKINANAMRDARVLYKQPNIPLCYFPNSFRCSDDDDVTTSSHRLCAEYVFWGSDRTATHDIERVRVRVDVRAIE